jgi:prepilin-type processing-associated H-X9-DG protein
VQGVFFRQPDNTNSAFILDARYALFAPYLRTTKVYVCPTDELYVRIGQVAYPRIRSYSMNAYAGWVGTWDIRLSRNHKVFRKQADFSGTLPAGVFLLSDVHPKSICWPYYGVHLERDAFFNFPGISHNRGSVLAFADGHAEYHRWRDPRTLAAVSQDYHRHNDMSPQNEDIRWLQRRTSVRK